MTIAHIFCFVAFLVMFLILSIPLHELCHFLAFKAFGCKTRLRIKFLEFDLNDSDLTLKGFVKSVDGSVSYEFPNWAIRLGKIVPFLILLAGGIGSALMLSLGFLIFPDGLRASWMISLAVIIVYQFLYGLREAVVKIKNAKFIPEAAKI